MIFMFPFSRIIITKYYIKFFLLIFSSTSIANKLNHEEFRYPTKEIIWVLRNKNRGTISPNTTPKLNLKVSDTNCNDWFNYCGTSVNTTLGLNTYDVFDNAKIVINGEDRFLYKDALYFRKFQPYNYHKNIQQKHIYSYSFALEPEKHQPTGTCNFSALNSTELFFENIFSSNYDVIVYTITYNILIITSGEGYLAYTS